MLENHSSGTSMFDLLAREWTLDDEIVQVEFNYDDTAVLFRLSSGKLAVVATKDAESTKRRTRVEVDSGRTTIRKRKNPIPSARVAEIEVSSVLPLVRMGRQGFLAIDASGVPNQITARGQCIPRPAYSETNVSALCSTLSGEVLAVANDSTIAVFRTKEMERVTDINLNRKIQCMSFSANGDLLATWGENCLTFINIADPSTPVRSLQGISDVTKLTWDISGKHIACASSTTSFHIVDVQAGTFQKVKNYPCEVSDTTFNEKGHALVTSGAFRLVGWSTDNLPMNDNPGTPMTTGKPGFVAINTVAAHPKRSLMAAGYQNGVVTIANIGSNQEMMVHQEASTQVNSMTWSGTGEHLAIGFKSGKAAVVSFPDQIFK